MLYSEIYVNVNRSGGTIGVPENQGSNSGILNNVSARIYRYKLESGCCTTNDPKSDTC